MRGQGRTIGQKLSASSFAAIAVVAAALGSAVGARAATRSLDMGDLLVSDANNARVLVVEPDTGGTWQLTPRAGSGPNLLVAPAGIAMCSSGTVYVVDATINRLIRIDPRTGTQSIVNQGFFGTGGPLNVGAAPWGIFVGTDYTIAPPELPPQFCGSDGDLWVTARGSTEVRRTVVTGSPLFSLSTEQVASAASLASARGAAIGSTGGVLLWRVLQVALGPSGWATVYLDTGEVVPGSAALPATYDGVATWGSSVALTRRVETVIPPGLPVCIYAASGVHASTGGFTDLNTGHFVWSAPAPVSLGGLFRCPIAIASAPNGSVYVTDTSQPFGGSARVIRLGPAGTWNAQTLVAEIPDGATLTWPAGIAVAPVSAPEPDGAAAVALGVLACFGAISSSRRRRAAPLALARASTGRGADRRPRRRMAGWQRARRPAAASTCGRSAPGGRGWGHGQEQ
ncbi:MAG: hypothetical protein M5U32_16825 [Myxococcota bacterium]|nr:hypothetical protein [Myxococcota bacterium]